MSIKETNITRETAWAPFRYHIFRMMWIASVASAIGTWMQDVGAAWLMTTLTKEPLMVASVQATTALAMFLLSLPAGALADIIDRRRYLIVLQSGLMIAAGIVALITFFGIITPYLLLFMTFSLGVGAALSFSAWIALMSELVPAKHLTAAVTLTGLSINISRSIGPALAGFIIAASGSWAVFALNAFSFFGIIIVLKSWKRQTEVSPLPGERLYGAMRAGLRYVKGSPSFQIVLIKATAFFIFASAAWALLPLIVRVQLLGGPIEYGFLLAMLGGGAVLGAIMLPSLREKLNFDQLILCGSLGFSMTTFALALSTNFYISCGAMILGGICWTFVISTLNALAQRVVSMWVKARAISIFFAVFFGGMALGSFFWGWIANEFSISTSLILAAAGLLLSNILSYLLVSVNNLILDHAPSHHFPAPVVEDEPKYDEGPVMVMVEYSIDRKNIVNFVKVSEKLRLIRLRDGAFFWTLFKDIEKPTQFFECFMIESWLEHLRQHERISMSDKDIIEKAHSFHKGKEPPKATHFVAHNIRNK
jgi:MFS family permease